MPFGAVFGHKMDLVNIKRQQFLTPQMYETLKAETLNTIETFKVNPTGVGVMCAEITGDFHLGDSRQPTCKSSLPFDLVS